MTPIVIGEDSRKIRCVCGHETDIADGDCIVYEGDYECGGCDRPFEASNLRVLVDVKWGTL